MITFLVSLLVLVVGYFVYGKLVEKIFAPDPSKVTPAVALNDGVDYVPLKPWRIFTIQFLNIAGLGPIFGAIMGGGQFGNIHGYSSFTICLKKLPRIMKFLNSSKDADAGLISTISPASAAAAAERTAFSNLPQSTISGL